jgi:uncharacterized membrane protein YbhN (UPF0104 family)
VSTRSADPREMAAARPQGRGRARPSAAPAAGGRGITARPWWPWARRILTAAFFALVAGYSIRYARNVDWGEVWQTMLDTPPGVLAAACAGVAASFALYCSFDLLGRRYTGHKLPKFKTWQVNFISYAFNLNMGSLVGSVAFRYRLYGRLGLDVPTITRVMSLSILTNWLGYLLLGGLAFLFFPLALPAEWDIDDHVLQVAGALLALVSVAYVAACAFSRRRSLRLRGHRMTLPSGRMAMLQLAVSCLNWSLIAGAIYVLLQQQVDYVTVLTVLLLAAVAGVVTHVPAGLGVLEAVFVALLGAQLAPALLIGTLLAYRALYYLTPLALAAVAFAVLEIRAKTAPAET